MTAIETDGELAAARARFFDGLVEHGWLLPTTIQGIRGLGEPAENVIDGLCRLVSQTSARLHTKDEITKVRFPPVNAAQLLHRTDYVASFPQLIGTVNTFSGGNAEHRKLLAAGDDWLQHSTPSVFGMVPAACHPLYSYLAGSVATGHRYELTGDCFRNEPSDDPMRMVSFRMREYVLVGSERQAMDHRGQWLEEAVSILTSLGLEIVVDTANDPFFGRAGALLAAGQREAELKFELLAELYPGHPSAIASGNYHQDHFGVNFGIAQADGAAAHSACFGFGLERIMLALVSAHGYDLAAWPEPVRAALQV